MVKGCRPSSGATGTSACKRSRGGSGIEDSRLQKPLRDGELVELCLTCVSPSFPCANVFLRLPEACPAPAVSPGFLLERGSGGTCPAKLVAAGQGSFSNPI